MVPNALQVKNNLILITVSQLYLKDTNASSYQKDKRIRSEFLDNVKSQQRMYDYLTA